MDKFVSIGKTPICSRDCFYCIVVYLLLCMLIVAFGYPYGLYRLLTQRTYYIPVALSAIIALALSMRRFAATRGMGLPRLSRAWRVARPFLLVTSTLGILCFPSCVLFIMDEHNQRQRYNQAAAIGALRACMTAQVTYRVQTPSNDAYSDNFRNLYYGRTEGGKLWNLISQNVANAYLIDNFLGGTPTAAPGDSTPAKPYRGHYFIEDPSGLLSAGGYADRCALMAIPEEYMRTGIHVLWVDDTGQVRAFDPKAEWNATAEELLQLFLNKPDSTPLAQHPRYEWTKW